MSSLSSRRLFLARHAQPIVAPGICYGRLDLAVIPEQERALLERLKAELPRELTVISSPLQRCASTAMKLHHAGWPEPVFTEQIAEMHFGEWEGRAWRDINREQIDAWAADIVGYCPPGGESVQQLAQRALACIAAQDFSRDVLLITHAGVMQVLTKLLQRQPLADFSARKIEYGELLTLERSVEPSGSVVFQLK